MKPSRELYDSRRNAQRRKHEEQDKQRQHKVKSVGVPYKNLDIEDMSVVQRYQRIGVISTNRIIWD